MTSSTTSPRHGRRRLPAVVAVVATSSVLTALQGLPARAVDTPPAGTTGTSTQATGPATHGVGRLAPQGCAQGAGTASCDLYAMAGTTSLLGAPVGIWGFSSSGAPGSASIPGPLLVVHRGDAVSITLHNQLAGQDVSLALPGQLRVSGAGDDVTGVPNGGTRTYTFAASRAGTFLYEAGHTPGGARQVAMGLAGALVVLPDTPSGYDDEAVEVLSEVDPALNKAPATFDMRAFRPTYRLLNGKPFPSSDPIGTDQGHTVLLRYVNAGLEPHSMTTLGADQTLLADDGHTRAFPEPLVTETVEPGATADTLVTMPTGPEAKITLFDAAQHLDNAASTTADPQQLAFGGMLTFLDTAAPAPSTDDVGPVSVHVSVSPSPSDGLSPVTVTADLSDATTGGSSVVQAEFVVDDAVTVGQGFGTPMTATYGTPAVSGATGTLTVAALDALDAGKHVVYVRGLDSAGNWGALGSAVLNLPKTGPQTTGGSATPTPANGASDVTVTTTGDDSAAAGQITGAEYFVDADTTDPALKTRYGTGTKLTLNRSATVVAESATLPAATVKALGEGLHHVLVHSQDSLGLWGPLLDVELPVDLTGPAVDAASVGPNPSNGLVADKGNPGNLLVSASITDRDARLGLQNPVVDAEAFLDLTAGTNPAGGSGIQMIAVDGAMGGTTESVYGTIPLSQVRSLSEGVHHVFVRGQDSAGNWGELFVTDLFVDRKAPVLGALTASPNPTGGAASLTLTAPVTETPPKPGTAVLAAAEIWFGTTDPGVGHASAVPVSVSTTGVVTVQVPLAGVASGTQQLDLRVQDLAGNWSLPASTSVTVERPNALFSDTFDNGLGSWSARSGPVSTAPGAALPAGTAGAGLQVVLPNRGTNRTGFVTDATPAAETTYHARFTFDRHTLASGNQTLTLFDTRTAANGQVFALQYRLNAGQPQARAVLNRSAGAAVTGPWVNLPRTGPATLQVDWSAATAGQLTLSVNGVAQPALRGDTSTLRIETARLGVVAGATTPTTGTAYLDSFVSVRSTF